MKNDLRLSQFDAGQCQGVGSAADGPSPGTEGGAEGLLFDDGEGVGIIGPVGVGEMVDGVVEEGLKFLAGVCYLFLLVVEREGVETGVADGVGADGAEGVGIQGFEGFGGDAQSLARVPPHGKAIVDEARGDIDGEGDFKAFEQGVGDVVVVLVAVVEGDTDVFFSG